MWGFRPNVTGSPEAWIATQLPPITTPITCSHWLWVMPAGGERCIVPYLLRGFPAYEWTGNLSSQHLKQRETGALAQKEKLGRVPPIAHVTCPLYCSEPCPSHIKFIPPDTVSPGVRLVNVSMDKRKNSLNKYSASCSVLNQNWYSSMHYPPLPLF